MPGRETSRRGEPTAESLDRAHPLPGPGRPSPGTRTRPSGAESPKIPLVMFFCWWWVFFNNRCEVAVSIHDVGAVVWLKKWRQLRSDGSVALLKTFRALFVTLFCLSLYLRILILCSMVYDCFLSEQKKKITPGKGGES